MTAALSMEPTSDMFDPDAVGLANGDIPPLPVRPPLEEMRGDLLATMGTADLPSLPLLGHHGLIIEHWSHLLAGYPRSGKTDLVARQIPAWAALGHRVLYITEESSVVWTARLSSIAADWSGVTFVFGLRADPGRLAGRAWSDPADIIVLDAIRNLLALKDENDNSEIARVLNPWIAGARSAGKTLIALHHSRKGAGSYGEGIAGGHALLGLFDVGLELTRDQHARRRLIRAYARVVSPPDLLYEKAEDGELRALGSPADVAFDEVRGRAKAVLSEEWLETKKVLEALGDPQPSPEQVRKALAALARSGEILRDPPVAEGEQRGKTYRWRSR